jgi:uncharacterized protein YecT (DUF1311 family)
MRGGKDVILLIAFAAIQAAYPPDSDCQDYGDGSTMAMSKCFKSQSETWERRLDEEYRAALARAEIDPNTLRAAQRAWLRYRDTNCEAYHTVKGSIATILTERCWRDMTRDRTLELHDMIWTG